MNVTDILSEFGWHLHVYHGVTALAIIASFACGLTLGRRIGQNETPHVLRQTIERLRVSVAIWHEKWRAERDLRETAEDRERVLRGAGKAYEDALREAV